MFKNTDWTGWTDDGLMSLHPILRHLRNIDNSRCTVLYQIYNVFVHCYSNDYLIFKVIVFNSNRLNELFYSYFILWRVWIEMPLNI